MKTANKQNILKKNNNKKPSHNTKQETNKTKQKRLDNVETLELVYYYFSNKILRAQPDHNHDHCKQKKPGIYESLQKESMI